MICPYIERCKKKKIRKHFCKTDDFEKKNKYENNPTFYIALALKSFYA